jgi:hypothetical protein
MRYLGNGIKDKISSFKRYLTREIVVLVLQFVEDSASKVKLDRIMCIDRDEPDDLKNVAYRTFSQTQCSGKRAAMMQMRCESL